MVGHSLTAFLKPWICWAWGSLGARPLVWISIWTFLPFFSSMAWPSAPERLRAFRWALRSVFLLLLLPLSSRSSPPLAKATEARLSDRATASSSTMVNFLDNFSILSLCFFDPSASLVSLCVGALIVGSALLFASPLRLAGIFLPTSMMPRAQPGAIGLCDYLTAGYSGQGDCPSPREFGHLLVSIGGGTIADGARITRVGLGNQPLPRTPARRTSENAPSEAV